MQCGNKIRHNILSYPFFRSKYNPFFTDTIEDEILYVFFLYSEIGGWENYVYQSLKQILLYLQTITCQLLTRYNIKEDKRI